jgi:ubiquinone/menaquinone biosynthesis C-methylase UbiE/uncharacterized protein YbaR (Trm112 family)
VAIVNPDLVDLLTCPACRFHPLSLEAFEHDDGGGVHTGVVACPGCRAWYPIEAGLLELLGEALAYREDRARYWSANETRLRRLDLPPPASGADPSQVRPQLHQQSHFDWYASNTRQTYTAYEQTPFWRAVDDLAFERWRKHTRAAASLLDIGCAQGRSTFKMMDLDLRIVAFDVSRSLVRQAAQRYRGGHYRARADFFVADAARLAFVDQCFDFVLVHGVLHHLPDPRVTCLEILRVLKSGGMYFGCENNRTVFRPLFDWIQRLRPLWHEEAGSQPLISPQEFKRWFEREPIEISVDTRVFLPPHLMNLLDAGVAKRLISATDRLFGSMPLMRNQGGLIFIEGIKARP